VSVDLILPCPASLQEQTKNVNVTNRMIGLIKCQLTVTALRSAVRLENVQPGTAADLSYKKLKICFVAHLCSVSRICS
jgi:hypothetical protein